MIAASSHLARAARAAVNCLSFRPRFLLFSPVTGFRLSLGILAATSGFAEAQSVRNGAGQHSYESRTQLEEQARIAERQGRTSEAWLLRSRLQRGDFQEGDRIVVVLEANPAAADTFQVRAGKVLNLGKMSDFSLEGILRSEISDSLRAHLARFLKNPGVKATPLIPIAVLGQVGSPGYYYTAADAVLRDLLMRAGGPSGSADLDKVIVKRSGETIWSSSDISAALSDGLSLDRLHLRAGDELFVPAKRSFSVSTIITAVSATTALIFAITQLSR